MAMAMAKQQEGGSNSNWEGMLKGWIPAHSDATNRGGTYRPVHSNATHRPAPKWRGEAKKLFMTQNYPRREDYDIEDRVYDISGNLSMGQDFFTPADVEELLGELQAYAEEKIIDVVLVLHSDGVLSGVLSVLYNKHANIRAKAAEAVTTMVQINPTKNQQLVINKNGLQLLLYNLTSDPDATSRTKALGAISALLRNNKPGITEFRLANGYELLRGALSSENVRLQRDALSLIQYLLHENSPDCNIVTELRILRIPCIMMHLASSDDAEVREAALRGLLVIVKDEEGGNSGQLVKNDDKLKQVLQKLIEGISAMAPEDLGATREERRLVESLWNACYNEPSSLGEKGLLVLPGEDAPARYVASKLYEPLLSAWDAAEAADGNSLSEKEDPLLLGLCPPSAATPTYQSNSSSKKKEAPLLVGLVLQLLLYSHCSRQLKLPSAMGRQIHQFL